MELDPQNRTTVRLPESLMLLAKTEAARSGITVTTLIEEGLRLVTADKGMSQAKKRRRPRVCKLGGGLMPGIDPVKLVSDIDEQADLDRLGRTAGKT